ERRGAFGIRIFPASSNAAVSMHSDLEQRAKTTCAFGNAFRKATPGGSGEGLQTSHSCVLPNLHSRRRVRSFRSAAIPGRSASAVRAKAPTTTVLPSQPRRTTRVAGHLAFDRRTSADRDVLLQHLRLIKTDSR